MMLIRKGIVQNTKKLVFNVNYVQNTILYILIGVITVYVWYQPFNFRKIKAFLPS